MISWKDAANVRGIGLMLTTASLHMAASLSLVKGDSVLALNRQSTASLRKGSIVTDPERSHNENDFFRALCGDNCGHYNRPYQCGWPCKHQSDCTTSRYNCVQDIGHCCVCQLEDESCGSDEECCEGSCGHDGYCHPHNDHCYDHGTEIEITIHIWFHDSHHHDRQVDVMIDIDDLGNCCYRDIDSCDWNGCTCGSGNYGGYSDDDNNSGSSCEGGDFEIDLQIFEDFNGSDEKFFISYHDFSKCCNRQDMSFDRSAGVAHCGSVSSGISN